MNPLTGETVFSAHVCWLEEPKFRLEAAPILFLFASGFWFGTN